MSIGLRAEAERNDGQPALCSFARTSSAASDQALRLSYRTVDGTAKASDGDYVAKTITIQVKGDSQKTTDETFRLALFGNSSNWLFTKNRGIGTILNDD